jgi:asparagine synthase (glutamine-hydrolysing)
MRNSIECRVPFLSNNLVEYMFSLPTEFMSDGKKSKLILRDIISEKLPRTISERKKKGFSIPKKDWLLTSEISIQEKILELFNQKCI